ncbi:glycosyltransferase family 4 protein [Flavobacterium praedii]|uniref:glycosyltransferase family 4 protein n=1 Tax=Flavobacterium praedii TaxID=3002900 RepID=UPI002481B86B|nr:glycosyltransferase family 4 protein [Flavobacterium praedii]
MTKVILISQVPLPFSNIGSWTTLYKNYIREEHLIDFIVCPEPKVKWDNVGYSCVVNDLITRVQVKASKNIYLGYFKALRKIFKKEEKYIIQIVDNYGIVAPLTNFLNQTGMRQQVYLQFFYHGFSPFYGDLRYRFFFDTIDEMVVLTNDSYKAHKSYYTVLPTRFSVLYNGIDTTRFFPVSATEKLKLKTKKQVADKTVFVWCSQNRPKKGLHLILDAWKRIYKNRRDIVLWVIGCEIKATQDGVEYLGRIPNDALPQYFQASDCYLFPTLCHEGFGLSLIEALHCGNYCIVSAIGGVPEVMQYGKLGRLIENPHFVTAWEKAILDFIENRREDIRIDSDLYSSKSWNIGMNEIITNAKITLNS